jgi:UDP-glucose 4-epimerase
MPEGSLQIVVTGGAGFIGSHLCDALIAAGHRVTCIDNLVATGGSARNVEHLLRRPGFRLLVEDILDWELPASLGDVDCIFHLAASKNSVCLADPERDLAVNALGTMRLVRMAARGGVRKFVHASTGSVTAPVSYYGVSKQAGESYCRAIGDMTGLDYTILRHYHVIGPRQDASDTGGVVPIFARRALAGLPLSIDGDGEQLRSFTSVKDTVLASLIVLERPEAGGATFTCASGVRVSIRELADHVIEVTGSRAGTCHAPTRVGDVREFAIDNSALRGLGLEFDVDWRATVCEVVDSLRERVRAA